MERPEGFRHMRGAPRAVDDDLFGRDADLDVLVGFAQRAITQRGSFVLVSGDAGIGKTRLVEELGARCDRDLVVAWGACWEEGATPLWPWSQVFATATPDVDLAELVVEQGPDRIELFDTVTRRLALAAERRPILVILEDLHWADRSSVALLEFLTREVNRLPIAIVGTCRDVELSAPLPRADRYIDLDGLDPAAIRRLLAGTTGRDSDPAFVARIPERT
ncbi:MAG: AAA family ATPase, partial [Acidimicrobiia bacterium]